MSTPDSIVEAQTEALLRRLAREQETRSRRAREAAEEQARTIVARAWKEARVRIRKAAHEERRGIEQALADRRAALATAVRQREQTLLRKLMDDAWAALPAELEKAWNDPEARREWCVAACEAARHTLLRDRQLVVEIDEDVAADLADPVRETICRSSESRCDVQISRLPGLGAGLRIRGGLACVDATIPGLLASRERIEADLLAEFERLADQGGARADE
jgi:vacuolar-type H+-ATPase subunit E/Vma4